MFGTIGLGVLRQNRWVIGMEKGWRLRMEGGWEWTREWTREMFRWIWIVLAGLVMRRMDLGRECIWQGGRRGWMWKLLRRMDNRRKIILNGNEIPRKGN